MKSLTFGLIERIIRWVLAFFFVTTLLAVLMYKYIPVYITPLMVSRTASQISSG